MTPQAATSLQSYFPNHNGFSQLPEQLNSWVRHQITQFNTEHYLASPCLPLRLQLGDRKLTIRLVIDRPGEQYLLLLALEQVFSILASLKLIGLSKREAEVLSWIIKGKVIGAIAKETQIRHSTIRKHLENIYSKLNVQNRTEAVTVALEKLGCLHSASLI
ncbi:response regulator transcription factor [Stanieria cyanosphaera]|nr:helix-turn-helix transcriptional regulator [Stanieria cyanosphaera]